MTIQITATPPANLIAAERRELSGDRIVSLNPARPALRVWAASPRQDDVKHAVTAARDALPEWRRTPLDDRIAVLNTFADIAKKSAPELTELIMQETGKARWDSAAEANLIATKVAVTIDSTLNAGLARVTGFSLDLGSGKSGTALFKPHGVFAVIGPFNFPAHLPNGHIIPALMMGNTVVFKPSDKAPAVGQFLAERFREALAAHDAPQGAVNLVHGDAPVAQELVAHPDIDGVLFTGSWPVGKAILQANLDTPGKLIALEMGGNNAAVVMPDADLKRAAIECARAAFVTTGQRCTCTRRLLVHEDIAPKLVPLITKVAAGMIVGDPAGEAGNDVFNGPIISAKSRADVLDFQRSVLNQNAQPILEATAPEHPEDGYYVTPGIAQVERFEITEDPTHPGRDTEVFGPFLRVATIASLDDAIQQTNATRYGLAASIFTADDDAAHRFLDEARAGCVNINTGTAGASGKLPFGGLGLSGNHRPAGSFSPDYCAYPVASMREPADAPPPVPAGTHWNDDWLHQ